MSNFDPYDRKTFVLGAGFSCAAQFPLVRVLKPKVISFIEKNRNSGCWGPDLTPGCKGSARGRFYDGLAGGDPNGTLGFEELLMKLRGSDDDCSFDARKILEEGCVGLFWETQHRLLTALPQYYDNFAAWLNSTPGRPKNNVVSFNWDLVVEQALEGNHFNWFYGRITNNSVAVLKPHGSMNWSNHRGNGVVPEDTSLWSEVAPASGSTLDYPSEPLQDPFPQRINEGFRYAIFPGSPESDGFPNETKPIWEMVKKAIATSDTVVFIGYSLPPYDSLAAARLKEYCSEKRIEVYNPSPDDLERFRSLFGPDVTCLPQTFEQCIYGAARSVEEVA
jgi:hypothetical protein